MNRFREGFLLFRDKAAGFEEGEIQQRASVL